LTQSVAPAAGVDQFGNNYVSGSASYQSSLASAIDAGTFTTYTGSLFFGWTAKAVIATNGSGDLLLLAASGRQVITGNNILDGGGGGATFQADVSVNGANLNVGNGSSANINLNPMMATPPNTAAVKAGTATLAQTEACLGALIQSLQNRNPGHLMHPAEWIGLASPAIVLAGATIAAVAKLTRITVALEELSKDFAAVAGRVDNHEQRIGELERNARGRHRAR
jgi:hypothetical protein